MIGGSPFCALCLSAGLNKFRYIRLRLCLRKRMEGTLLLFLQNSLFQLRYRCLGIQLLIILMCIGKKKSLPHGLLQSGVNDFFGQRF